jgi:hypothetical protein
LSVLTTERGDPRFSEPDAILRRFSDPPPISSSADAPFFGIGPLRKPTNNTVRLFDS